MKITKLIKNPYRIFSVLAVKGCFDRLPDERFLRLQFRAQLGRWPELEHPQTFNEKLQWLKLHDRRPEYSMMVDKYRVRDYIREKIGEEYLIPLLGIWDAPDEIDFDALPDQFVLKCNHNSGKGLCICRDKSRLDIEKVKAELRQGLAQDYYLTGREWPYRDVPRKIICEKYMEDYQSKNGLVNYKFYCFNGEPRFLHVSEAVDNHACAKVSYLTLDWEFAPYERTDYAPYKNLPRKPLHYNTMLDFCRKLSEGVPFLRVDLYEINYKIYFSELTFFPGSGFTPYRNPEHDSDMGSMLTIPQEYMR